MARRSADTEYTGEVGPAGIAKRRPGSALSASDEARLRRLTGTLDPTAPVSMRVWRGEAAEKNARQREGDRQS